MPQTGCFSISPLQGIGAQKQFIHALCRTRWAFSKAELEGVLVAMVTKLCGNRLWKKQIRGTVEVLGAVLLDGHPGTRSSENAK
jgi:hypothetical protein